MEVSQSLEVETIRGLVRKEHPPLARTRSVESLHPLLQTVGASNFVEASLTKRVVGGQIYVAHG